MNSLPLLSEWPPLTRRLAHACAIAALLAVSVAPAARAATIRGTLHATHDVQDVRSHNAYPGRASSLPMSRMMAHGAVGDAVVWLEHVPASADTVVPGPRPKLAQKDQCFQPRVLPIAVGTAVDFPNMDPIFHNVFSASPIKRFDLGKYPRGQSKRVVFDKPGLVNVYCDIHSDMEAFVLVLTTHVFTQPEANGEFALPPVPPGDYVLHVWHPDRSELRRDVQVPAKGDLVLDLDW